VVQQQAAGTKVRGQCLRVAVEMCRADVLDHADARDLVEGLVVQLAVVGDADLDAIIEPGLAHALARELRLRLGQRDAGDLDAMALGRVDRERAPAAADVEEPLARLEPELLADQLTLVVLRLLEGRRPAREDRAAVGHHRVEEQREELVAGVVVVSDSAAVASEAVEAPALAQLDRRHPWWWRDPGGAGDCRGEPECVRRPDLWRLPIDDESNGRVELGDLDIEIAADVGAPEAELARTAQEVCDGAGRAQHERRALRLGRGDLGPVPEADPERALGEHAREFSTQRRGRRQHAHNVVDGDRRVGGYRAEGVKQMSWYGLLNLPDVYWNSGVVNADGSLTSTFTGLRAAFARVR
jgi:hypothetical protein